MTVSLPQGQVNAGDRLWGASSSPGAEPCILPLSSAQLGIWFAQRLEPNSSRFNIAEYTEIRGPLDSAAFERALQALLSEADSLRVRLVERDGVPWQEIVDCCGWSMPFVDLRHERNAPAVALQRMQEDLARAIDLTAERLFSFVLFQVGVDHYFWYCRYHHIVLDGYGMAL